MAPNPVKLSPSDLTFLWDECPRCFYLKYIHGINRPAAPFPSIFGAIDRLMKAQYAGQPASELSPALPPGTISVTEGFYVVLYLDPTQPIQINQLLLPRFDDTGHRELEATERDRLIDAVIGMMMESLKR